MTGNRPLTWKHGRGEEMHLLPRQGEPSTFYEWILHTILKFIACFPVYIGILIALTLVVHQFGIPFVLKGNG